MSLNHPRNNNRFNRSLVELLRRVEAMQAGERLVVERHANGLRFKPAAPSLSDQNEIMTISPTLTSIDNPKV